MKNVISLREIVDCDAFLKERCLNFRIHLRDACGRQSCWIEPLSECGCDGQYEELYAALEEFFGNLRYKGIVFIVCFFSGFSCLATLPYLLVRFHVMTWEQLGFLLLAGVAAAGGQFAITAAYCHAPDRFSVLGYAIIFAMAVAMFFYNKKRAQNA